MLFFFFTCDLLSIVLLAICFLPKVAEFRKTLLAFTAWFCITSLSNFLFFYFSFQEKISWKTALMGMLISALLWFTGIVALVFTLVPRLYRKYHKLDDAGKKEVRSFLSDAASLGSTYFHKRGQTGAANVLSGLQKHLAR
jgi:hypothetical protein